MELLFRKYFWVVNLTFLLGAAYFGARTVNAFVAAELAPVPEFNQPSAGPAIPRAPEKPRLTPEALSAVTGIALPKPEPVAAAVEEAPVVDVIDISEQEAVKSGLRVKLVGTMVANRDEWSMASIEDVVSHQTKVYMVGDLIQGAEVIDIERMRVILNNQGRKEFIDGEPGDGSAPIAAAPPTPVAAAAPSGVGAGIRATSDDTYEVPKDEINKALGNLNDIAMQARIVPAFKDGVATGFKLFSIRPDSLYSKIGIQNGDVVRRINGYEINSPDKALEVYSKLKESSRIEIEIDRNGTAMRKTYNVR